ncbi:hypothetical protein BUALT_Bualt14G0108900 [Buddleja alternifolia]|uniref:C2H2-type domain-containing protein n=1 Tax=Buddleja alternifolia TaxID=168488 RepID=A0AAV6WGU5_9LAMI|nr:hypothetical protein BUALT_Bualt14G0108900 [Buddleja alternifolia]
MERRNLCNINLKQHGISNMKQMYGYKIKDSSWNYSNELYNNNGGEGEELGFPWPPRCYKCSFCKREFRSAQALGGHMNVHRRDRARLRQSPPPSHGSNHGQFSMLNLNVDPNPSLNPNPSSNPNFFPSSPTPSFSLTKFPQFTSTLPPIYDNATEMKTKDLINMKASKGLFGVEKFNSSMHEKGKFVRLDLEIGVISQSEEELDLELRLGYS